MFGRWRDATLERPVGFVSFPARLLLRKLGGEGSEYFAGRGNLTALSQTEESSPNTGELAIAGDRYAHLFDL